VFESAPAVHQHEGGDGSVPNRPRPDGKADETGDANQAEDRGHLQAACPAQHEPQERPKNLATIQGIDGQDVENQQTTSMESTASTNR